jgi:hypothetical protein
MSVYLGFITGFMFGLEFYNEEDIGSGLIIDVGIVRVTFEVDQ